MRWSRRGAGCPAGAGAVLGTRARPRYRMVTAVRRSLISGVLVAALLTAACSDSEPKPAASGSAVPSAAPSPTGPDYTEWQGGTSTPVADPMYPQYGNPA